MKQNRRKRILGIMLSAAMLTANMADLTTASETGMEAAIETETESGTEYPVMESQEDAEAIPETDTASEAMRSETMLSVADETDKDAQAEPENEPAIDVDPETKQDTPAEPSPEVEALSERETEELTEEGSQAGTEAEAETEPEEESETETEEESETETEEESETETEGETETEEEVYTVFIRDSSEYEIILSSDTPSFEPGELVTFDVVAAEGYALEGALATTIPQEDTGDTPEAERVALTQSENSLDAVTRQTSQGLVTDVLEEPMELSYSFRMPEANVMLAAAASVSSGSISKITMATTGQGNAIGPSGLTRVSIPPSTEYFTAKITLSDGTVISTNAQCLQPGLTNPTHNASYTTSSSQVTILDESGGNTTSAYLARAMYYLYGGPAWGLTVNGVNAKSIMESYGAKTVSGSSAKTTDQQYYVLTHYVLSYLDSNGKESVWNAYYDSGSLSKKTNFFNDKGKECITKLADAVKAMPVPGPALSKSSLSSTYQSAKRRAVSESVTYQTFAENTATIALPQGVSLVLSDGSVQTGSAKVPGGSTFHLERDVSALKTKVTETYAVSSVVAADFTAVKIDSKASSMQDASFAYYLTDGGLSLNVTWEMPDDGTLRIRKKASIAGFESKYSLSGAVYTVYRDAACTQSAGTVTIGADGTGSMTLPLGSYYVKETAAPKSGVYSLDGTVYPVSVPAGETIEVTSTDSVRTGKLEIQKDADELDGERSLKGIRFLLTCVSTSGYTASAVTDETGKAVCEGLIPGTWRIEEDADTLPEGYVKAAPKEVILSVDAQTGVFTYDAGQTAFYNKVSVEKRMRYIRVRKRDAQGQAEDLSGFRFAVEAAEDITGEDGTVQTMGGKPLQKGTLACEVVTDKNGIATSPLLYPGTYLVREVAVGSAGLARTTKTVRVTLKDTAVKTPETVTVTVENSPTTFHLLKRDAQTNEPLEGVGFEIQDRNAGTKEVRYTDANGQITWTYLPKGTTLFIREVTPKKGYAQDPDTHEIAVDESGWIDGGQEFTLTLTNRHNKAVITKEDIVAGPGSTPLPGALLRVTAQDGSVIDEWVSEDTSHEIDLLEPGNYLLTEMTAPEGYEMAETVPFTITGDGTVVQVVMRDAPYREVQISKTDITGEEELPGACLEVRREDGSLVEAFVSGETPHPLLLPSGVYTLTETKPADGFSTAETITFTVLQRDHEGDVEVTHVTMRDEITKVSISKKDFVDGPGGEELPGASLTLTDSDGTVIDEWVSTEVPHEIEGLTIGTYTLREVITPDGYEMAEEITFEVKDTGEVQHVVMYDAPWRDVVIHKQALSDGEGGAEIPGASLSVADENGTVLEEWISGEEPHTFTLPSGTYTLTERLPADGYVTAETVSFTVTKRDTEGDVEVTQVHMLDDVTKVEISKTDLVNGTPVEGATLIIRDEKGNEVTRWVTGKKPHYIEKLPIGSYTLTEITAPAGYEVAETVPFTVRDTGEIQKVEMKDRPIPQASVPKTGDETNAGGYAMLGCLSALLAAVLFLVLRRKGMRNV